MRRFCCLLSACLVSLCSLTAFSRLHVNAADRVEYTFSPAETAALFGYDGFQVESNREIVKGIAYSSTNLNGVTYACPHEWYANYVDSSGDMWIGIRVYGNRNGWLYDRGTRTKYYFYGNFEISLEDLYYFSMNAGYLSSIADTTSNVYVSYYENGSRKTVQRYFTAQQLTNPDTGSNTNVQLGSPPIYPSNGLQVQPVYDFVSSGVPNFGVTAGDLNCIQLSEPFVSDYFNDQGVDFYDSYTYVYIKCPTITIDKDKLDVVSEKLDTITSTMTGIEDQIKETNNLLDNIKEGISNVFDSITALPAKIWDTVSSGLTELFLPSEEAIEEYKSELEFLLSDHFGAVYDVIDLITSYFEGFSASDPKETITFPEVTLDVGAPFTFGGWEVQVVPDGFDFLIESLKWIIDLICTLAVVNTLKEKLSDVLVGGEQDVN